MLCMAQLTFQTLLPPFALYLVCPAGTDLGFFYWILSSPPNSVPCYLALTSACFLNSVFVSWYGNLLFLCPVSALWSSGLSSGCNTDPVCPASSALALLCALRHSVTTFRSVGQVVQGEPDHQVSLCQVRVTLYFSWKLKQYLKKKKNFFSLFVNCMKS